MLTNRRRQFLEAVKNLAVITERPVHYCAVADTLGVSRWTAYDVLKALEKEGFLRAEYSLATEERLSGRSMIFYSLTSKGNAQFPSAKKDPENAEEWKNIRKKLTAIACRAVKSVKGGSIAADETLELERGLSEINRKPVFCAYMITLCIIHFSNMGKRGLSAVADLISKCPSPEFSLGALAGGVIGVMSRARAGKKVMIPVLEHLSKYQSYLTEATSEELRLLSDFMAELIFRLKGEASGPTVS